MRFGSVGENFGIAFESLRVSKLRSSLTILGVTIPSVLAPRVHARAWSSDAEGWEVEVRISLPLIGLLVAYAGRLVPEP